MDDKSTQQSPLCPHCGGPMFIRVMESEKRKFWGCMRFPECRGTANFVENGAMRPPVTDQWRDDTARMVLLALIGNWQFIFDPNDKRSVSQEAVKITDELIEELRKNG